VPDYPVPGVNFYDMNSLFASPVWSSVVTTMVEVIDELYESPSHIVGLESRGFVVGAAIAYAMELPFVMVRKKGAKPFVMVRKKGAKYPGKLFEETYELEYGSDTLTLQEGILGHVSRCIITDDLVATGGSALATKRLIEQTGARVLGIVAPVNLAYLNKVTSLDTPITALLEVN
jgi:adenine phosphoribosyltransferase